jgi:hypothetical protein
LTDALRKRARQEKTTVHAALLAAAGIAARRNPAYGSDRDKTVDDLWDLAKRSKDKLSLGQSENGVKAVLGTVGGILQLGLDAYSACEEDGKLFLFDIHLSNLGAVTIPSSYGALSLRQLWGPGVLVGFEGEQTLGVSTLNGRLCLLHTSHRPLPGFIDQIESTLARRVPLERRGQFHANQHDCQDYRGCPMGLHSRSITITDGIFGSNAMHRDLRIG